MTAVDWLVAGSYVAVLIVTGILATRWHSSPEDYFLASRSARWPTIGLALIASNISSTALVGLAGGAYGFGVSVYNYEWVAAVILVFLCIFLLPQLLATRVFTIPEFLERRYDARARTWLSALTLFLNVFVDGAGALYSGAIVCRILIPGAPLWILSLLLAGAAATYTITGGLRAVLRTEVIQAGVLLFGAAAIAVAAFAKAGGWHVVMTSVDPAALSLIRPIGDPAVPWPGLLTGVPLLGFYYWCTNQVIVQRILSARDVDHGRWGALFAGFLKLPVLFLMVLPGICARLLFPNESHADRVYPFLISHLLPAGLVGLAVASFIAATMTSVASMLNSASTLVTMDLARRLRPASDSQRIVVIGRIATCACLALAVLWAPQLERLPSLWQYLQAVLAYAVPPIVAVFLAGLFWRGANAAGANAAFLVGSAAGLLVFCLNVPLQVTHIHFLYVAPLLVLFDLLVLIVVSRWSPMPEVFGVEELHWSRAAFARETQRLNELPVWRNYRLHSIALLVLAGWIVYVFR